MKKDRKNPNCIILENIISRKSSIYSRLDILIRKWKFLPHELIMMIPMIRLAIESPK